MPIIKSAKKALRTAARRKDENDLTRANVKNAVKGLKVAVTKGEKDVAGLLNDAYKQLDFAAKKNVIHKNKAARIKSQLAKSIAKK